MLIGFGLRLPVNLPVVRIFSAIAVGAIVIALVRLVLGLGNPSMVTRKAIASLWQSLERVHIASLRRDSTPVTFAKLPGTSFWDTSRVLFSWDSSILWHALRSAMVVLVALIIASHNWGDPLKMIMSRLE